MNAEWHFFAKQMLKLVSAIFYQIFYFNQMIAPQKLWKMFFISSKKLFPLLRSSNFCISIFSPYQPLLRRLIQDKSWSLWHHQLYKKNLITHFAWYLGKEKRNDIETLSINRVLNKALFFWKNDAENVHQKLVPDPFLLLVNISKQPLHERNYLKNKIFWKRITKKP